MLTLGFPLDSPFILRIAIGDVAEMLGIPGQTINAWRNRGLLPEFGEFQGETKARTYGFGEIVALAVMRDLTTGPAGIGASTAAKVAIQCVEVFLAGFAGTKPRGMALVLEAGGGQCVTEAVPYDGLAEYIAHWRRESLKTKRTRLEIIDIEHIALRVNAKLAGFENRELGEKHTEEEITELIEPFHEARIAEYLEKEIEKQKRLGAEVTEQAA